MEELRKFQSSTFDTHAKLIEDQNTFMELSGRVQELQNEVNCMSDSKDFQDAESVRRAARHLGYTWYIGKRFCKSKGFLYSSLSSRIESMEEYH